MIGRVQREHFGDLGLVSVLGGAVVLLCFGVMSFRQELGVSIQEVQSDDGLNPADVDRWVEIVGATDPGTPARGQLYSAIRLAHSATKLAMGPRRDAVLAAADQRYRVSRAARPVWGEADMVGAYIASLQGKAGERRLLDRLTASYRGSPYLRLSAGWRVSAALPLWSQLPSDVQLRVADEAVLEARRSRAARRQVFALARTSAGYEQVLRRWQKIRSGDADLLSAGYRPPQ